MPAGTGGEAQHGERSCVVLANPTVITSLGTRSALESWFALDVLIDLRSRVEAFTAGGANHIDPT